VDERRRHLRVDASGGFLRVAWPAVRCRSRFRPHAATHASTPQNRLAERTISVLYSGPDLGARRVSACERTSCSPRITRRSLRALSHSGGASLVLLIM